MMAAVMDGSWSCARCTYVNHAGLNSCEMCDVDNRPAAAVSSSASSSSSSSSNGLGDGDLAVFAAAADLVDLVVGDSPEVYLSCPACSFHNALDAVLCTVCEGPLTRDTSSATSSAKRKRPDGLGTAGGSSDLGLTCPRCHVHLDRPLVVLSNCPTCDYAPKYRAGTTCRICNQTGHWAPDCPFRVVDDAPVDVMTDGIIELLSNNLTDKGFKKNTTEYALCSPCLHISQRGTEGYDWSCGYRNIQMMCHALLNHPTIDYRSRMFNGKGDIPDVNGIQSWIEKAWADGFDDAGRQELGGVLLATDTWIGAWSGVGWCVV